MIISLSLAIAKTFERGISRLFITLESGSYLELEDGIFCELEK